MPPQIPTREPNQFTAGDTWQWTRDLTDYSAADGWALSYVFVGPGRLEFTATPAGTGWAVTVDSDRTRLPAGRYTVSATVSKAGERYTVLSGVVTIVANPATAGEKTPHAQKMLEAIEAILEGRISADLQSYQIAGRQLTKIPVLELKRLRREYRDELARLNRPGRATVPIRVRFGAS